MKKTKRGTPDKLVCEYCGAVKTEITFVIGACSKPGTDWCMVYGTGKMACPACYKKATEEAEAAEKGWEKRQAEELRPADPVEVEAELVPAVPAAVPPREVAPAAPVEPAACQGCSHKRGKRGPCSDYGGFGCGLYFEQHPETRAPAPEFPAARAAFESADAQAALRPILERVKNTVWLPEYRAKVSDAEALGVLVSKFFKWEGSEILAVASSALEDANYHGDAAIVERMRGGEDIGALLESLAKELSAIHSEYQKDCPGGCPTLELIKKAKGG